MQADGSGNIKYSPLFTSPVGTNPCQHQRSVNVLPKVGAREEGENQPFVTSPSPATSPRHPSGNMRDDLEPLFNLEGKP